MKKQLFLPVLAICSLLFISCNNDKTDSGGDKKMDAKDNAMSNTDRNKANVLKAYDALNAKDLNAFANTATKDMIDHSGGANDKITKGIDSVKANLQMFLTAFPDMKVAPTHTLADGEWVAVFNNWTGTWKGDFNGMKPTGKSFFVNDADLFKMDSQGMIIEHWPTQEFSAIAMQVGMQAPK